MDLNLLTEWRRWALVVICTVSLMGLSVASAQAAEPKLPPGLPTTANSKGHVYNGPEPPFIGELPEVFSPATLNGGGIIPAIGEYNGGGQWTCNNTWDTITNYASGVLIGNCSAGSWLNRTKYSAPNSSGVTFSGGYIGGSYNACGWLETGHITYRTGKNESGCGNPNSEYGNIGYAYNSATQQGPTYAYSRNPGCQLYANVHPWESTPVVTDPLTGALPVGTTLDWRYIVGYGPNQPHKDGRYGDYWVAVYDPAGYGGAYWVYAPFYGCFQNPNGEPVYLAPGEGGYWFPQF